MSNLIINIRFWYWHLQIEKGFRGISWRRNSSITSLEGKKKIEIFKY